ncbi:MAG: hypothetical protein WEE20_05560, partial [Bacteroidota bacterium]
LWQFRPKPGHERQFESAYGPEGDWAKFFRQGNGYIGTKLLKESGSAFYFTIDEWSSKEAYEVFRSKHEARYRELDTQFESLTASETHLGSLSLLL